MNNKENPPVIVNVKQVHHGCGSGCVKIIGIIILILVALAVYKLLTDPAARTRNAKPRFTHARGHAIGREFVPLGFEPRQSESKSDVLPLHHGTEWNGIYATQGPGI